jgi:hypothetical protein
MEQRQGTVQNLGVRVLLTQGGSANFEQIGFGCSTLDKFEQFERFSNIALGQACLVSASSHHLLWVFKKIKPLWSHPAAYL